MNDNEKRLGRQIQGYNDAYWDKYHEVIEIKEVIQSLLDHIYTPPENGKKIEHKQITITMAKAVEKSLAQIPEEKYSAFTPSKNSTKERPTNDE